MGSFGPIRDEDLKLEIVEAVRLEGG